jgi:hypothetical protein
MPVSFSGLDLSFLNDPANRLPPSKVNKYRPPNKRSTKVASPFFMSDISEFVSPVGADPEVISSRTQLREHEKKHNVIQCGDYKPGEITSRNEAIKAERDAIAKEHTTPPEWLKT